MVDIGSSLANSSVSLPVSKTTVKVCGGVPTEIFPNHWRSVPLKKSARGTLAGPIVLRRWDDPGDLRVGFRAIRSILAGATGSARAWLKRDNEANATAAFIL